MLRRQFDGFILVNMLICLNILWSSLIGQRASLPVLRQGSVLFLFYQ